MNDQQALVQGSQYWMLLSVAAVLPILWSFTLALHFARPYILRYLQGLTLRFGGDVWWLSYILIRDGLLVVTFARIIIHTGYAGIFGWTGPWTILQVVSVLIYLVLFFLAERSDREAKKKSRKRPSV